MNITLFKCILWYLCTLFDYLILKAAPLFVFGCSAGFTSLLGYIVVNLFYITDLWVQCDQRNDSSLPFGWCLQWWISNLDVLIQQCVFVHIYQSNAEVLKYVAFFSVCRYVYSTPVGDGWCWGWSDPLSSLVNCVGQGPDCLLTECSVLLATCIHIHSHYRRGALRNS